MLLQAGDAATKGLAAQNEVHQYFIDRLQYDTNTLHTTALHLMEEIRLSSLSAAEDAVRHTQMSIDVWREGWSKQVSIWFPARCEYR